MTTATSTNSASRTPDIRADISLDMPTIGTSPNDSIRLTFSNGRDMVLQVGDLSGPILAQALMHGLKQKLVDAAAISRNPDTGRTASIADKYAAVSEVLDRLVAGEWNKRREGSAGAKGGLLFRALCRMYEGKKTPEVVREWLDTKTDAEQAALRAVPAIAAIITELRAESVKASDVDTDALLEGLAD